MDLDSKKVVVLSFAVFVVVLLIANLVCDVSLSINESSKEVIPDSTGEYDRHGNPLDPNDLSGDRYAPIPQGGLS